MDRNTTFVALGGGVIGDMCGFAAAAYQRGVHFIQARLPCATPRPGMTCTSRGHGQALRVHQTLQVMYLHNRGGRVVLHNRGGRT